MRVVRAKARTDADLCSGPAKLCQALGLDGTYDGADLVTASHGITVVDDGVPPPVVLRQDVRIGLSAGADLPWRWWVPDDPNVSRPR